MKIKINLLNSVFMLLFALKGGSEKWKLFYLNIIDMKIFQTNKKRIKSKLWVCKQSLTGVYNLAIGLDKDPQPPNLANFVSSQACAVGQSANN